MTEPSVDRWKGRWNVSVRLSVNLLSLAWLPLCLLSIYYLSAIYRTFSIQLTICFFFHLTYLSLYLAIFLSIYLSICSSTVTIYRSIHLSFFLSSYLSIYLSVCLSVCPSVHLPSPCLFLYLSASIYIYIYLCVCDYIVLYLYQPMCLFGVEVGKSRLPSSKISEAPNSLAWSLGQPSWLVMSRLLISPRTRPES